MRSTAPDHWLSSKDLLMKTGISRATLNNYIKLQILPRPFVQKGKAHPDGPRRLGYFPPGVVGRIEEIKRRKKEGQSIEEIKTSLQGIPSDAPSEDTGVGLSRPTRDRQEEKGLTEKAGFLQITFEELTAPAYLVDYDFQVVWANNEAENRIFKQRLSLVEEKDSRNLFKLLFHWGLHDSIRNWKDLMAFHVAFAKARFPRSWMGRLFRGISASEVSLLQNLYDKVRPSPKTTVRDTPLSLVMEGGGTMIYRIYNVLCKEGILFLFNPESFSDLKT